MTYRNRITGHADVDPGTLQANAKNWRMHPEAQRRAMRGVLGEVGWVSGVLVNQSTGHVVDGHLRIAEAIADGAATVPVTYCDLTQGEEETVLATLDPIAGMAEADERIQRDLIAGLHVTDQAVAELLASLNPEIAFGRADAPRPDDDQVPDLPLTEPVTLPGDVWIMGNHRLYCGDCREILAGPEIAAEVIDHGPWDILVTDPPYGVSYADKNEFLNAADRGNRNQTPIEGDHDNPEITQALWRTSLAAARPLIKAGGCYYITGPQGGELLLGLMSAIKDAGFPIRHTLIWAKNHFVLGRADYNYQHEPILYAQVDDAPYYRHETIAYGWADGAGHQRTVDYSQTSLWEIDRPSASTLHPTMKPVELFTRAMWNSSTPGDRILDPFAGSGTALIAAEKLERACTGIEIDPAYCDVIVRRWQEYTDEEATLLRPGEPKSRPALKVVQ